MQNICTPLFDDGEKVTGQASAAILGCRFLKISGNMPSGPGVSDAVDGGNIQVAQCVAGDAAIAVSEWDAPNVGDLVGLHTQPGTIVPVDTGAAIAANQHVQADALGRAIPLAAGVDLGTAVSGAPSPGQVFVKLRV